MAITTNNEYLLNKLSKFGLVQSDIDVIVVENSLGSELDIPKCKIAMYNSFSSILPLSNVSEGNYSITWNIEALKIWYNQLCKEVGKSNAMQPKITNKSKSW
jgi:hypothetical protein